MPSSNTTDADPQAGGSPKIAPLALSMGDPAGIGLDITLSAWLARVRENLPIFCLLGDVESLRARAQALGLGEAVPLVSCTHIAEAAPVFAKALPVLPVSLARPARPGEPDAANADAILNAIRLGVRLALSGEAGALVTNPIAKGVFSARALPFAGHTEFLAALAREAGLDAEPVMMLVGGGLRVIPATIHIPLAEVPARLSTDGIVRTAQIAARALIRDFGIPKPRLALTGLNPHAGEGGLLGHEDAEIIAPAIARLRESGLAVSGPHPADTLFHARARAAYDVAIAMYHDQALIPIKTIAFDEGVNVTLGLPFIRTSPDHGTAYALAGSGQALATSLIHALRLAAQMAARRARYDSSERAAE